MPRKPSSPDHSVPWPTKIVGYGDGLVADMLGNARNWRGHPPSQLAPLLGILTTVGLVQNVIINKRTSSLWSEEERHGETLVDGHARVLLAQQHGQATLPVTYVDLAPNEEAQVLLTFDPLGGLIEAKRDPLSQLLQDVTTDDSALQQFLSDLAQNHGLFSDAPPQLEDLEDQYGDPDANPEAFWKTISLKVPPEIWARYQEVMASLPGESEAAKFLALLDQCDA